MTIKTRIMKLEKELASSDGSEIVIVRFGSGADMSPVTHEEITEARRTGRKVILRFSSVLQRPVV